MGLALCGVTFVSSAAGVTATKKKTVKRHTVATSAKTRTTSKTGRTTTKSAKGKKTIRRAPARSHQLAPTKERYQQIQQALASKGYFAGEANGQWGAESANALKRFQTDQNLTPDGKLTALSLIALGLGPKRLSAQSGAPSRADLPQ